MATAEEYHQYARECLLSASAAQSEAERRQFLDMADAWTRAARLLERLAAHSIDASGSGSDRPTLTH